MTQSLAANFWNRMAGSIGKRTGDDHISHKEHQTPTIGDRYAQTVHGSPVWVVENVLSVASSRYPLVRLTRENYPDLMKIVSVSTLADQQEFTRAH